MTVTDADREKAMRALGYSTLAYDDLSDDGHLSEEQAVVDRVATALAEERERGIDIGLQNATSIDHYEVGHCCRLCGETWPCDRARTVGLQ